MTQTRAVATRSAVLVAAARVFERHGFSAASISQILNEANVTKGALYFHFDSKASLASAIIEEQSNWRVANTEESTCPTQRLIDLGYRFVYALQSDPLVRASIRLTIERNTFATDDPSPYRGWVDAITAILVEAHEADDLQPDRDPNEVAWVIVGSVTGTQLLSEAMSRRTDLAARLETMWRLLLPGVVREEVLKGLAIDGGPAARLAS